MLKPQRRWFIQQSDEAEIKTIVDSHGVHPIIAKLLLARGLKTEEDINCFLYTKDYEFHDPFLLDGMQRAVEIIHAAILKKEKILIYGDYDADGVTSTTVLYKTLKKLEADFAYYIPNRFTEGYGLNKEALIQAAEKGFKVIITVDTGISAIDEAKLAKELGITLIITDHHEPQEILPEAFSVINPKQSNDKYPYKLLAGVGVAFKLAHALLGYCPEELLDIVAIGTIADLVPLTGENRLIALKGLAMMNNTKNIGLRLLIEKNGLKNKPLTAGHVGFIIAPRINASGRLDTASNAVRLFTTNEEAEATKLLELLEQINKERQTQVDSVADEAIKIIETENMLTDKVLVIAKENWNIGVIGIVASRIVEKYYRPTIILSIDKMTGTAKGSARSIEGFDIFKGLSEFKRILSHFGGHPAAAGLTIEEKNINQLKTKLNRLADELLSAEDFIPIEKVDAACTITEIDINLIKEVERMAPFGIGNPNPRFLIEQAEITNILTMGNKNQHLKVNISERNKSMEAIMFKQGHLYSKIAHFSNARLLGELSLNEWHGKSRPQFIIRDVEISELQVYDWRKTNWQKLLSELYTEQTVFLYNDKVKTTEQLAENLTKASYDNWNNDWNDKINNILLYHLPPSVESLEQILSSLPDLERVYCIFTDNDNVRNTVITRDHFKELYQKIKASNGQTTQTEIQSYFSNRLRINSGIVQIMLDVFYELGFIILEEDKITINSAAGKRELSESKQYNNFMNQEQLRKLFILSNHQQLRKWFIHKTQGS